MAGIRRTAGWFFILMKKHLRGGGTWFLIGLLFLFLFIFQGLVLPGDHTLSYGLLSDGADCGAAVIDFLGQDTLYNAVPVSSYGALERGVASGRLDCGFVLTSRINEAEGAGLAPESIQYICSTSTSRGAILKEKVYAAVLRETTRAMLENIVTNGILFKEGTSGELKDALLSSYQGYLEGNDTIRAVYETVETENTAQRKSKPLPQNAGRFLAVCSILVFSSAMIFGKSRFSADSRRFSAGLPPIRRRIWLFTEILVPVLIISAALIIPAALKLSAEKLPPLEIAKAALLLLLCGAVCSLWISIYASFFRREGYYISSIPVLLILCIVTSPSLTSGVSMGSVLTVIGRLFPTYYL